MSERDDAASLAPEDQSLPCLAKGETKVDGALMPVACDLWHNHDRRHWDERVFTFWESKSAVPVRDEPQA